MAVKKKRKINTPGFKTHHKIMFTIFATVGAVTVWRGIWEFYDSLPFFDNPMISALTALIVIIIAAVYFKWTNFY